MRTPLRGTRVSRGLLTCQYVRSDLSPCHGIPANMRLRDLYVPILFSLIVVLALSASPGQATNAIVKDGDTIQIGEAIYRLDGIDAPELDQICIDDHADPWTCGLEARERLSKLISGRDIRCDDLGPDPVYKKRRIGLCTVQGESSSLD